MDFDGTPCLTCFVLNQDKLVIPIIISYGNTLEVNVLYTSKQILHILQCNALGWFRACNLSWDGANGTNGRGTEFNNSKTIIFLIYWYIVQWFSLPQVTYSAKHMTTVQRQNAFGLQWPFDWYNSKCLPIQVAHFSMHEMFANTSCTWH